MAKVPRKRSPTPYVVSGPDLGLREITALDSRIVQTLPSGMRLQELARRDGWVLVRERTGLQGWVRPSGVTPHDARGTAPRIRKSREFKRLQSPTPVPRPEAIVRTLIRESIANHPGSCACPYHARQGRILCKTQSAHSRGGSRAPLCFASDITPDMIAAYGQRQRTR
jgi:Bacterial SH3 domain